MVFGKVKGAMFQSSAVESSDGIGGAGAQSAKSGWVGLPNYARLDFRAAMIEARMAEGASVTGGISSTVTKCCSVPSG